MKGGVRVPTSDPHTINACWFLFLLFAYLLVAEAASFDKKELCRSDTPPMTRFIKKTKVYLTISLTYLDSVKAKRFAVRQKFIMMTIKTTV